MPRTVIEATREATRALCAALLLAGAGAAQALNVFTCEPEWAALVRSLAPQAQVTSATHFLQDPHHIEARPSLIAALRRADLAVCTGAELEAGWLPMLQQRAGNPRVLDRADGMFFASDHVELIDARAPGSPFDGDVHAAGNPHFQLDPDRLLEVARDLADTLAQLDPAERAGYASRFAGFERDWKRHTARWRAQGAPLKGQRVVAQHSSFAYWWRWLGMTQTADLEPKPGLPPTPGHLNTVLQQARQGRPMAVVATRYQDSRSARWLATQLGQDTLALSLPTTVDDPQDPQSLVRLFDTLLQQLLPLAGGPAR
jgi:zinc/manganese transport system substrate-binding protein